MFLLQRKIITAMKKNYIQSQTLILSAEPMTILMASGDRVNSNVDIHGGDRSGNAAAAF
jgi:hypothetical protein